MVKRFDVRFRYNCLSSAIHTQFDVVKLGSLCVDIYRYPTFYGIEYLPQGIPVIKGENITRDGEWVKLNELGYIDIETNSKFSRSILNENDLVMTVRGEVGKVGIVNSELSGGNISANVIKITLKYGVGIIPQYIWFYLNSAIGKAQIRKYFSGGVQETITVPDICDINIVLPSRDEQLRLVAKMSVALAHRTAKLQQADALLARMNTLVLKRLGIALSPLKSKLAFAVKRGDIANSELYCRPTYPDYLRIIHVLKSSQWYQGNLENYVQVNPRVDSSALSDNDIVSFVPMTAVGNKDNTVAYESRMYGEVKTGYTVFQRGDLLWAKITPCMQNGKSCLVSEMPTSIGFGSTEFHILRKLSDKVYMPYVWALLSNNTVLQAAQAVFNGSAGQQRVADSFLKKFPLPLPDIVIQKEIADSVFAALEKVHALKREAEMEWAVAKARFDKELLGGVSK
jgi:type I restriction enzyme S subunit